MIFFNTTMTKSTGFVGFAFTFVVMITITKGEDVLVHILHQNLARCSLPNQLEVTILRHNHEDTKMTLRPNDVIRTPRHVTMMSNDDFTGTPKHHQVRVHDNAEAYHNVDHTAAFVVRCLTDSNTNTPYFILDGNFFINDNKFVLRPKTDDVRIGPIDVTIGYVMNEVEEFKNPGDHEFIEMSNPLTGLLHDESLVKLHERRKRDTTTKLYHIGVLPIIDYHLYEMWLTQNKNDEKMTITSISNYFTNVFTSMHLKLKTLQIPNSSLSLSMLNPFISKSPENSPYTEKNKEVASEGKYKVNVVTVLNDFKQWLNSNSVSSHDHAMLFTGYDVYGGNDNEVGNNFTKGLAYVGSMCSEDGSSSSVVQDQMSYQSELVAIHELGHSLGSKHDGDGNECSSTDRYIMATGTFPQTEDNKLHPFMFSECSQNQIYKLLQNLISGGYEESCLSKLHGSTYTKIEPLDAQDQCKALFGDQSYICWGGDFPPFEDVCHSMYCAMPGTGKCRFLTAATGTCCANGKFCDQGKCVPVSDSSHCVMNEKCPFTDLTGPIQGGKTCTELGSPYCYFSGFYSQCCNMCESSRTTINNCEFGDRVMNCDSSRCGTTLENGVKYDIYCCKTCTGTEGISTCRDESFIFQGKLHDCTSFIEEHGKHYCYFSIIHQNKCCQKCSSVRSTISLDCMFGDMLHKMNCTKLWEVGRLCNEEEKGYCCETCPKLTAPSTISTLGTTQSSTSGVTEGCSGSFCSGAKTTKTLDISPLVTLLSLLVLFMP